MTMDVDLLTDDEVIALQDRLALRAAFIKVTPEVEEIVRDRLATLDEDRVGAIRWGDAMRHLDR